MSEGYVEYKLTIEDGELRYTTADGTPLPTPPWLDEDSVNSVDIEIAKPCKGRDMKDDEVVVHLDRLDYIALEAILSLAGADPKRVELTELLVAIRRVEHLVDVDDSIYNLFHPEE